LILACIPGGLISIAVAQEQSVSKSVTIRQEDVMDGKVPLRKLIESGAHFFSAPFMPL